jgi:hypothetical protein
VVAAVAAVVVLLGGLAITGFVAPGFFLSGADTTTTAPTTPTSKEPEGADPKEFLATLVDALDTQDADALKDLTCSDAKSSVDSAVRDIDSIRGAELVDTDEVADDEVTGTVEVSATGKKGEFEVTVVRDGDDWCWQDIDRIGGSEPSGPTDKTSPQEPSTGPGEPGTPTAGGKPVDQAAVAAMQSFLDSVNAGDAAGAKTKLCSDAINTPADVDELVGYQPKLEIDPTMDGISSGAGSVQLYLRGTAKGQELSGYSTNLWVTNSSGPWCVHAFRAVVI